MGALFGGGPLCKQMWPGDKCPIWGAGISVNRRGQVPDALLGKQLCPVRVKSLGGFISGYLQATSLLVITPAVRRGHVIISSTLGCLTAS